MLFNDSLQLLLVYPSKKLQDELQDTFLAAYDADVNVYIYDKPVQDKEEVDWNTFMCGINSNKCIPS